MSSSRISYKPLLDFYPERSVQPANATDTEVARLESVRSDFTAKPAISIRHPGYPERAGPLLSFPALDFNGIDYDLAIHACYIIVGNIWPRDGISNEDVPYLSYSKSPRDLCPTLVIRPLASAGPKPYPITPSFDNWQFPHISNTPPLHPTLPSDDVPIDPLDIPTETAPTPFLPAAWRAATIPAFIAPPTDLTGRVAVIDRDRTCRVTQYGMGVEAAHLVPKEAESWFNINHMKWYARKPGDSRPIDDLNNMLLLRGDIHHMLDRRELIIIPKKLNDRYVFVLKVIKSNARYLYDAYVIYHNRICQDFLGVRIEFLFGRFAWNIFHPETMHVILTPKFRHPVRVYVSDRDTYEVQDRLMMDFKKSRSRSQSVGGSNKRARSSGPADDDDYSDGSDETLASDESDEDGYQERLYSLDAYKKRLSDLEDGEGCRGRKRVREHDDRFSNASTEVDVDSDISHLSKGGTGKSRKLGEDVTIPSHGGPEGGGV
ncbi:hypothetical protein Hte_005883 [Hypoxylon texense]